MAEVFLPLPFNETIQSIGAWLGVTILGQCGPVNDGQRIFQFQKCRTPESFTAALVLAIV